MIIKFIKNLFSSPNYKNELDELKSTMLSEKVKDTAELKKINRTFRLLLQEGNIEVTIKNVDGVFKELRKRK